MEKGQKVAFLAIGVNLLLFGMKYLFAELSGSMALKAEAIHSLSEVIASSTVFTGLIIAKRKTRSFPYGLYKVENLVSVAVALAIFYAGYEIAAEACLAYLNQDNNFPESMWQQTIEAVKELGGKRGVNSPNPVIRFNPLISKASVN